MSVAWIILFLFIAFVLYILVIPVILRIDTYEQVYFLKMPGILGFSAVKSEGRLKAVIRILFLKFKISSFVKSGKKEPAHAKDHPPKRKKEASASGRFRMFIQILKTFSLKEMVCELDTGDFPLNAQLIPLAYAVSNRNIRVSVNFQGINQLYMVVYTQLYKIIFQIIKNKMFNR